MQHIGLVYILASIVISVKTSSVQLLPSQVNAVENSSVTLTCLKSNGFLMETIWINSQIIGNANLYFFNGQCVSSRFLKDSNLFDGICNGNGTYSVIIKRIDRTQHGAKWTCSEPIRNSNIVTINVIVPAVKVVIYSDESFYMRENQTQTVRCQTSTCRPSPTVKWYLRHSNGKITYDITENSTQSYSSNENGLIAADSTLQFFPNRTFNNWHLFCEVWTQVEHADISSKDILVNVLYPPEGPPVIHGYKNGTVHQVVESESGPLNCSVIGGNPLATLTLTCFNKQSATATITNTTVTRYISWKAVRNQSECKCASDHIIGGKQITYLKFEVMCPPRPSTVRNNNVTALLHSDVTLQFIAHGYFDEENKTTFTWYKQNMSLQNGVSKHIISSQGLQSVLIIRNITQTDYGRYRVVVRNSVGQYMHYYELHKKDSTEQVPVESAITAIIIGVAVGTFAFTILVVVLSLIGYKYIRRSHCLERSVTQATENENDTVSENQTASTYDDINLGSDPKTVYEQLDDQGREGQKYLEMQDIKTEETSLNYINTTV